MASNNQDRLVCEHRYMKLGHIYAERFYKSRGAAFSGWVVRDSTDQFSYSDPIANKADAIKSMRAKFAEEHK